jgi:hypothetical protein
MNRTVILPKRITPIGCFYTIVIGDYNVHANCIDATPDGQPKRMRVQTPGKLQGRVMMPAEYTILERDTI